MSDIPKPPQKHVYSWELEEFSPNPITLAELKTLTREQWDKRKNDPEADHSVDPPAYGGCADYVSALVSGYYRQGIDYIALDAGAEAHSRSRTHSFLAVHTSDNGVMIVDPTIKQIFPDYPDDFFIGTAPELAALIQQKGGPNSLVRTYPAGQKRTLFNGKVIHCDEEFPELREYYFHPSAGTSNFLQYEIIHSGLGGLAHKQEWVKQWDTLGPFAPDFDNGYYRHPGIMNSEEKRLTYSDLLRFNRHSHQAEASKSTPER